MNNEEETMDDETEDTCIRDDSTECDCSKCAGAELAWERVQGWHEDDGMDEPEDDELWPIEFGGEAG
jgi:hypothetical protein